MRTAKQAALLRFLEAFEAERGHCPSYREMARALNLKSPSSIHRMVASLEERGLIRRLPNLARAITTRSVPATCPACGFAGGLMV